MDRREGGTVAELKLLLPVMILFILLTELALHAESRVMLSSGDVSWAFDTRAGLSLVTVEKTSGGRTHSIVDHPVGRPLFDLAVTGVLPANAKMNDKGGYDWKPGPGRIDPASFGVTKATKLTVDGKDAVDFEMRSATSVGEITGNIRVVAQGQGEVVFFIRIRSESSENYLRTTLRGPILEEMDLGNDAWYFFPRGHGVFNSNPCRLASAYGQYVWMQCMGGFGKDTGIAASIVPLEHEAQPKTFITQKAGKDANRVVDDSYGIPLQEDLLNQSGLTQTIVWPDWVGEIGKDSVYGPVAVRIRGNGDWRDIYAHYREYLKTWWKPKSATHRYVRYAYHEGGSHSCCGDTEQEWVNWGLPFHDWVEGFLTKPMSLSRYLEYSLMGPNNWMGIRDMYQSRRDKGLRNTVYVHAKAVDPRDEFSKTNGYNLTLETPPAGEAGGGPPGTGSADGLQWMNLNAPVWREWLGDVVTDILTKTGADGIRLDCIGFTMFGGGNGANPRIQTPPTRHDSMLKGSVDTVTYVREAMDKVNPNATLGAENLGTDLMMNLLDYSLCYNTWEFCWLSTSLYPSPVLYVRFVFPDFKFLEITGEPHWDGSPYGYADEMVKVGVFSRREDIYREALHVIMFNGVGVSGWNRAPNHIALLETCGRVLNGNTHCFEGNVAIPEIGTLKNGVYANLFAATKESTSPRVVTLMNWTTERVDGPLVQLKLSKGEHVVDMVRLEDVSVDAGGTASLSLEPMRSAVLRVVPGEIRAKRHGRTVLIELPDGLRKDRKLVACIVKPDGRISDAQVKMTGRKTATVGGVQPEDRVAVQIMRLFLPDVVKPKYVVDDVAIVETDWTSQKRMLYSHIEGEDMKVGRMSAGFNSTQIRPGLGKENRLDMAWHVGWSGARQFGWHGNRTGDQVELTFCAPEKRWYDVYAAFGKGPLYGKYELHINGRSVGKPMDLFSRELGSSGDLLLGRFELAAGENTLKVRCLGFNAEDNPARRFSFSNVAAACIRFGASPGHVYWLDNIHFRSSDNSPSIPTTPQEPFTEGARWSNYLSVVPEPSLPTHHYRFQDFVPSPSLAADTTLKTEGEQSVRHENPGWPLSFEVAFGAFRGFYYAASLPWNMTKDWTLNLDIMIHSKDDTFREVILIDGNGNRLMKDISAIVPHNGDDFTHLSVRLGDMTPDPLPSRGSTFGLDYLRLRPSD